MATRLCIECATIWAVPDGLPLICPRCQQPLSRHGKEEPFSEQPSWIVLVSRAAHGPAPRIKPRWRIG